MQSRPEIVGTFGVVTSTHWLATTVGMSVLEKGGNAFDAAVATGCALHIVEPDQNGPGGEVPIVLFSESKSRVEVICGQGVAPASLSARQLRELGHEVVPGIGVASYACQIDSERDDGKLERVSEGTINILIRTQAA